MELAHVAAQQEGAGHGRAEHLVRVDGDAVGEGAAVEAGGGDFGVEDDAAAPAAVDVQPEVVRLADGAERAVGVEGAVDGGAGGGVDEEGRFAALLALLDQSLEFVWAHAACGVDGHTDDVLAPQAEEVCCFFDRVVAVGGGEEGELVVSIALGLGRWVQRVPRDDYGRAVGCAAAGLRDASRELCGETKETRQVLCRRLLDEGEYGRDLVDMRLETSVVTYMMEEIGFVHLCSAQQGAAQTLHPRHSCWRTACPVVYKSRAHIKSSG